MMWSVLLLWMIGIVFLAAILTAIIMIGMALYLKRKNKLASSQPPEDEVSVDDAIDITSTWNMLNH